MNQKSNQFIPSLSFTLQGRRADGRIITLDEGIKTRISFLPSDDFMEEIQLNVDMSELQQELEELIFKYTTEY